jgi:hypothetical protein
VKALGSDAGVDITVVEVLNALFPLTPTLIPRGKREKHSALFGALATSCKFECPFRDDEAIEPQLHQRRRACSLALRERAGVRGKGSREVVRRSLGVMVGFRQP